MVFAGIGLAAALAATLASAAPALAGKKDNSIRFAYDQAPENVAPFYNTVRIGVIIGHHVWDTLIHRDPKTNEYKGQLATAWRWIDDRTLELDLRRGVKFHDGAELEAEDVVYTLNYVSKPENKAVAIQNVAWIDRTEKLDKYKVRIVAKAPFPAAIEYLAGPLAIFPHEYFAKSGPQGMNLKPVGSGPYRVTEHALGKYVRMERNPEYFKDSPKPQPTIDKIEDPIRPGQAYLYRGDSLGRRRFHHERPPRPGAAAQGRAEPAGRVRRNHALRVPASQHAGGYARPAIARHPRAQGGPACDRPRAHGQIDRR